MSSTRTAWHPAFAALITERAPAGVEVRAEVQLGVEPQKADLLLIRRHGEPAQSGQVLRRIWGLLSAHTLVEFKSVSRPARPGDWIRLYGYASQYHAPRVEEIGDAANLSLVMVAACMTPTLEQETQRMRWNLDDLGGGYYRVVGPSYSSFLVLLDDVSESEHDPLLGAFGHRILRLEDREAWTWFIAHLNGALEFKMSDLEGYEDYVEKIRKAVPPEVLATLLKPEERVAGLKPEERVAGLKPEERVAGLSPDETVLLLADELLRLLPEEFIQKLPEAVRDEVRRRLASIQ